MITKFKIALDDKGTVELNDEGFDIDGWVDMKLERELSDGTIEMMTVEVHIRELSQACTPFLQKYWENREHDL